MKLLFSTLLFCLCFLFTQAQQDTVYFEFGYDNRPDSFNFVAAATDTALIKAVREELMKPLDERFKHINGKIDSGTAYNYPIHKWHFITDMWGLADFSIEVCDGSPMFVNDNIDYWVDTVGQYCPWSSEVRKEINLTSTQHLVTARTLLLYPNPAGNYLYLQTRAGQLPAHRVVIYDALGRRVMSQPVRHTEQPIDLTGLDGGVYYLRLQLGDEEVTRRFVRAGY